MSSRPEYNLKYFNVTFPKRFVAQVEINRPEKFNAFIQIMWENFRTIIDSLSADQDVRAIVLTAAGEKAFTAGLDFKSSEGSQVGRSPTSKDPARTAKGIREHMMDFQDCVTAAERCTKPVISVMHGFSYGLAIDMTCCTDIRICSADTKFAIKEVDIGLAADIGTLTRLPKLIGSISFLKSIAYTARDFSAAEALQHGFVSAVYPTKAEALAEGLKLAEKIAEKSPVAVFGTKELINYSMDRPIQDGLRYTAIWNAAMLQTGDVGEAMKANIERTKGKFAKL